MLDMLRELHPVVQALIATGFTWGVTALGAASVFLTRDVSRKRLDWMLGFAAGVMIAARRSDDLCGCRGGYPRIPFRLQR